MAYKPQIFISYSHADGDWCDEVARHLRSLHDPVEVEVWVDKERIRAGRLWSPIIDAALARADVAVLLISANFLSSEFIRATELPRLLARRLAGLYVVPVLVGPCVWNVIDWLKATELRPRGGRALALVGKPGAAKVAVLISEVVAEIAGQLRAGVGERNAEATVPPHDGAACAARLIARSLLQVLDEAARGELAARLVARIAEFSGMSDVALYHAVRMFIEFHLLRADEPCSPRALLESLDLLPGSDGARRLLSELKRGARVGDFAQSVVEVNSLFFMHAREREALWQDYFEAVLECEGEQLAAEEIASLFRIRVKLGFVAPQFLVAGLLSHFNDDWRPVLNAYQQAVPSPKLRCGGFESLQASQWNCWLVWGPSIPLCTCAQWAGKFAFQYGYGDENNSLPLLELETDAAGTPPSLAPLATELVREGRGARLAQLTGRLRWGPYFLRAEGAAAGSTHDDPDLDDEELDDELNDEDEPSPPRLYGMAPAQAAAFCGESQAHTHHSDGLVLQLESVDSTSDDTRAYFSAYLWLMFLVAGPPGGSAVGPPLLRRKDYPPWPERAADRVRVRDARLWEDLLPVFVHANIADPAALAIQRGMLVNNALGVLRAVWHARAEYFDAADVARGIRFHLVCASDYSGCGEPLRYPSAQPLATLLQARLADEADRDFATAVMIAESDTAPAERPWGLSGYFSSCHLPELVADYFEYVAQIRRRGGKH